MKPISALEAEEARRLRGLLFDLDDTLLSHGVLTRAAYDALWRMDEAGLKLVAVTGRPTGWGEVFARQWPIAGCIVENGAVSLRRQGAAVVMRDSCDEAERRVRRTHLAGLVARVREAVPEAALADDASMRRSDVTWDIGERARLPEDSVRRVVREIEASGARWSRSSVHLHATFDAVDKAIGAVRFCTRELGEEAGRVVVHFAFVGDSDNDGSCFAAFRTTFGVANVRSSLSRLSVTPRYVATGAMGDGFAEVASEILGKRLSPPVARVC